MAARQDPRIVLDCRWLGKGGQGRVTEVLLRGLRELRPAERWILWGSTEVERFLWDGAEASINTVEPTSLRGQRNWFEIPPCDLTLFMHQQRPLRNVPSLTVIYDTIPLHFSKNALDRWAKQVFLRKVASISREVITLSQYSAGSIQKDLGVAEEKIKVARWPVDRAFSERILSLRRDCTKEDVALYVGHFLPHKNLSRLIEAFGSTEFHHSGGKLRMIGGDEEHVAALRKTLSAEENAYAELLPRRDQEELDALFARSRFLVQPSLEEGFGLPVWEALSCGLPVCASDRGSLPEITQGLVRHFPAESTEAMAASIDDCATAALGLSVEEAELSARNFASGAPTIVQFAGQFHNILKRHLPNREENVSFA